MRKLYKGEVIEVKYHFDQITKKWKSRPVVVFKNTPKDSDVISVYCTTQNDGDDENSIFVKCDSDEGKEMGLEKDTYIRPNIIKTIPVDLLNRPIGKCPYMVNIQIIIDKKMAG